MQIFFICRRTLLAIGTIGYDGSSPCDKDVVEPVDSIGDVDGGVAVEIGREETGERALALEQIIEHGDHVCDVDDSIQVGISAQDQGHRFCRRLRGSSTVLDGQCCSDGKASKRVRIDLVKMRDTGTDW